MGRKEVFLKTGVLFHKDPKEATKEEKSGWLRKIIIKLLGEMGVPIVDPCCDNGNRVPLAYNRTTGQDEVFIDGQWVPVEQANGQSTSTTTTLP